MTGNTTHIKGCATSLAQLARTLERVQGETFWDQTGFEGKYSFEFSFSSGAGSEAAADTPALATALHENLGLSLRRQKGPVETLVVDSVQKPSED